MGKCFYGGRVNIRSAEGHFSPHRVSCVIHFSHFIQGRLYTKVVMKSLKGAFDTFLQFVQKYTWERGLGPREKKKKQLQEGFFFKFPF